MGKIRKKKRDIQGYTSYILYVLALEENKFYVGITQELQRRMSEHKGGKGASFTRRYKPIGLVFKSNLGTRSLKSAEAQENEVTISLMKKYGIENVRGGDYCQIDTDSVIQNMRQEVYKKIMEAYENSEEAGAYKKIDVNLHKLLNGDEPLSETNPKKRKMKLKADFWWKTYKKDAN